MVLWNAIAIKLPNLNITKDLGTVTAASNMFSITLNASIVTGFIYIYKSCMSYTLPLMIAILAAGFLMISFASGTTKVTIGAILTGISFACIVPFLFNLGMDISTLAQTALSVTLIVVSGQGAGFFAPFVLTWLGKIPLLSNEFAQSFLTALIILLVVAVIVTILTKKQEGSAKVSG